MAALPEESLIAMGLMQGKLLGLGDGEGKRLQTLFSNCYERVRQFDPFRTAPSALPYCFAQTKPTNGLATLYVPANITTNTRTVLFLHGYGGSLLAYLHFIANTFSNDIVVCPAYGIAPATIPPAYIDEDRSRILRWSRHALRCGVDVAPRPRCVLLHGRSRPAR